MKTDPTRRRTARDRAPCDCDSLRAHLAQVDRILDVPDHDPASRIGAIERLIDRADGVDPSAGEDDPDPGSAAGLMSEMFDSWNDATLRAQAAMELVARLAMPDRVLRREVRMRGVTAVVHDRMDELRGRGPRAKIDRENMERLADLNVRESLGGSLSDDERRDQEALRILLIDGDR